MIAEIKELLKDLIAKIESWEQNVWAILTAYVKEAVKEEEAALFPLVEAQAKQLLLDEAKTQGLDLKGRIAMAESEIMMNLVADGKVAALTLVNSYIWLVAHNLGLVDGNQGNLPGGTDATPSA